MLLDAILVMASVAVGVGVWISNWGGSVGDLRTYMLFGVVSLPMWLFVFNWQGFYRKRDDVRLISDVRPVVTAVGLGAVGFILMGWPVELPVPRGVVLGLVVVLVPAMLVERQLIRMVTRRRRRAGRGMKPVVILGTNSEALDLAGVLKNPVLGRQVVAFISTEEPTEPELMGLPVVHSTSPAAAAQNLGASIVVMAATSLDSAAPASMLRSFLDRGIEIEMTSALTGVANDRVSVHALGRFPMLFIDAGHRGGWRAAAKRLFDIVIAGFSFILLCPVLLVAAISVKLDSPGPVLFRQERVGWRGKRFEILKLRTMVDEAEDQLIELQDRNEASGPLFKIAEDPRITRMGKLLRRTSIDEIPQLWNVLRGEMSIVGPRPALPNETQHWDNDLGTRLRVRPGMTGMWQVSGRSETGFDEYQRLDLFYIDNWSMLTDLGIVLRTVPAVLSRRGAA
ncbi:MAG: sugar transferase [Actinomycetia bacterium]|nr:sugar transferase [Actinomycetes bacterium]